MKYLHINVRFLDDRYHGLLGRNGPAEWPPSPFRLFCSMVAGAAQRNELDNGAGEALCWLQALCSNQPPMIIAPRARRGNTILRYGPDNDDKFHSQPEACRSEIPTMPTLMVLEPEQEPEVHYLWNLENSPDISFEKLRDAARNITRLGWGIDMAFADAKLTSLPHIQKLPEIRWHPTPEVWREFGMLRVPTAENNFGQNTLSDLKHCHHSALYHLRAGEERKTVDKPRVFDRVFYRSTQRPLGLPYAVFELRHDNGEYCRYSQRKLIHIAGMVRHLAKKTMQASPPPSVQDDWVEHYVVGHRPKGQEIHRQFSYLPLPSIGHEHADQIVRRVMIVAPIGDDNLLEHLVSRLAGQQLIPKRGDEFGDTGPPTLVRIRHDNIARHYTRPNNRWASVTPVILPGHDDKKPQKTRKLIAKALAQSGIEQPCEYEWSAFSSFRKSFSAHKYDKNKRPQGYYRPSYLENKTAVHLRLRFKDDIQVPGPLFLGAGRHCGLGLMANLRHES